MKNSKNILSKFYNLRTWRNGDQRAPHKPFLILYALGKLLNGKELFFYEEAEEELKELLMEFGPLRSHYSPEYPFWRMQKDGIWNLTNGSDVVENSRGDVSQKNLILNKVAGGFDNKVLVEFHNDRTKIFDIVKFLLEDNFPDSMHDDILEAVCIDYESTMRKVKKKRDPKFRNRILNAYEYKCAVCGFDVRLNNRTIGLEAAHIKWHQAGGPDIERNGISLCTMHHKLFDIGAFSLVAEDSNFYSKISDRVSGTNGFDEWLMRFHNQPIAKPQRTAYYPEQTYCQWHVAEVFKGYGRD